MIFELFWILFIQYKTIEYIQPEGFLEWTGAILLGLVIYKVASFLVSLVIIGGQLLLAGIVMTIASIKENIDKRKNK